MPDNNDKDSKKTAPGTAALLRETLEARRLRIEEDENENVKNPFSLSAKVNPTNNTPQNTPTLFTRKFNAPKANKPNKSHTSTPPTIPDIIVDEDDEPSKDNAATPSVSAQPTTPATNTPVAQGQPLFIKRNPSIASAIAEQPTAWMDAPPLLSEMQARRKQAIQPHASMPSVEKSKTAPEPQTKPDSLNHFNAPSNAINTLLKELLTSVEDARKLPNDQREAYLKDFDLHVAKITSLIAKREELIEEIRSDFKAIKSTSFSHMHNIQNALQDFERDIDRHERHARQALQTAQRKRPIFVMPVKPIIVSDQDSAAIESNVSKKLPLTRHSHQRKKSQPSFDFRELEALAKQSNRYSAQQGNEIDLHLHRVTRRLKTDAEKNHFVTLIATLLKTNGNIHTLDLSGNQFSPAHLAILSDAMSNAINLTTINMRQVNFEKAPNLITFLGTLSSNQKITAIYIDNCLPETELERVVTEMQEWHADQNPRAILPTDAIRLQILKEHVYGERLQTDIRTQTALEKIIQMEHEISERIDQAPAKQSPSSHTALEPILEENDDDEEMILEDFNPDEFLIHAIPESDTDLEFFVHYAKSASDTNEEPLLAPDEKSDIKSTTDFTHEKHLPTHEDEILYFSDEQDESQKQKHPIILTEEYFLAESRTHDKDQDNDSLVFFDDDEETPSHIRAQTNNPRPHSRKSPSFFTQSTDSDNSSSDSPKQQVGFIDTLTSTHSDMEASSKPIHSTRPKTILKDHETSQNRHLRIETLQELTQLAQMIETCNPKYALDDSESEKIRTELSSLVTLNLNSLTRQLNETKKQIAVDAICTIIKNNFTVKEIRLDHNKLTTDHLASITTACLKAKEANSPLEKVSLKHSISADNLSSSRIEDLVRLKREYKENLQLDSRTQKMVSRIEAKQLIHACENYMAYLVNEIIIPTFKKSEFSYVYTASSPESLMKKIMRDIGTERSATRPLLNNQRCAIAIARYQLLQELSDTMVKEKTSNRKVRTFDNKYRNMKSQFPQTCPAEDRPAEAAFLKAVGDTKGQRHQQVRGYFFKPKVKKNLERPKTAAKAKKNPNK
jgi:hypothetical protein